MMDKVQQNHFDEAKKAYDNSEYKKSTQILINLYDEIDDPKVISQLGQSLFMEQKYVESFRLIEDNFNYFIENDIKFVIEVYLKNRQFIPLRIIIQTIKFPYQSDVLKQIDALESENNDKQTVTNKENLRQFMHMGGQTGIKQKEILEKADELPLEEYLKGAQFNLVDPDVNQIWRVEILSNLSQLKFDHPVKFIWLDGKTYSVLPSEIIAEDKTTAFVKMQKIVKEKYGQTDPIKFNQMEEAVSYDLRLLYPFVDEVVKKPQLWVDEIHHHIIDPNSIVDDPEAVKVSDWLKKIDDNMKTLLK